MQLCNEKYKVNINLDETYTINSVDNKHYDVTINPSNRTRNDWIKIFSVKVESLSDDYTIALIGDYYSCVQDCALLENNVLTVMQNKDILKIDLSNKTLIKHSCFDSMGCFYGIYKILEGYIIYGEIDIVMLDFDLNKLWVFSGKDIFVSFEICDNIIKLYDWDNNYYEVDFCGKQIK